MIYLEYVITAFMVVFLSIKASRYIDLLDKNTSLSGAFLGGIVLSAVTSLPELFTSISATALLDRQGLCLGNILGSDLFNLAALSLVILLFFKGFNKGKVSKSYRHVAVFVLLVYLLLSLNFIEVLHFRVLHLSITSILIALIYVCGAKYLAVAEDVQTDEDALGYHASISTSLTLTQIAFRFFIAAVGLIVFSIMVTYFASQIASELNLVQGFAGAVFLGIATSLPEVTSTVTLFKMKNYNIAVGNIIGSNLFNFIILVAADLLSLRSGVYDAMDHQIVALMVFGAIATVLFWIMLRVKKRTVRAGCALATIACYIAALLV